MGSAAVVLKKKIEEAKEELKVDLTSLRDLLPQDIIPQFERGEEEVKQRFKRDIEYPVLKKGPVDDESHVLSSIDRLGRQFETNKRGEAEIKELRGGLEPLYRNIQLLYPSSEQDFTRSLWWIANQGKAKELDLIEQIEPQFYYKSKEITFIVDQAKKAIFKRESNTLMTFYAMTLDELTEAFEKMTLNLREEPFAPLPDLFVPATRGKAIIQLAETKDMIKKVYKGDEVKNWLETPNRHFLSETPKNVILKGKGFRILQHFIRLGEGIS